MASGKDASVSVACCCSSNTFTDVQKQRSTDKPNINRLKRANRTKKSDCEVIGHDADQKSSHISIMQSTRPLNTHESQCSTKQSLLLNTKTSQMQLEIKSKSSALCHQQPCVSRSGARAGGSGHEETPAMTSLSHRSWTREEVLKQIQTQNRRFPVRRVFHTLLKRLGESKSALVVPVTGNRKPEVKSHSVGCFRKRRRSSQDEPDTVDASEGHVRSINVKRRKTGLDDDVDVDVTWTEKFGPRRYDEVVGNEEAVRTLYSWLKEWRMRADVEERRRRAARRIEKESKGLWDCGDFEGDPPMEECDADVCNTLLIHGSTGVGKSAAVYACAKQLGFKVLEVNSSSLRSGRLILSQLRESTQSHQVGAPHRSVAQAHTPAAAARNKAPHTSVSCTKAASVKNRAAAPKPVTLTRYFTTSGKAVHKHSQISPNVTAADEVTLDESGDMKRGASDKKNKMSLILFEEVDIVFDEDVGFLTAVRSLMNTTKRPIILTTNDPLFGETFGGGFKELRFKTPATESVVSYLQCVCAVESVKADPEHIRFLLQENNGDVRRCVLELELWAKSGAGNTHKHLHNRALACGSFAELESSRCVEVLVDCWRKGRSLLYSNFDLVVAPPTVNNLDQSSSSARNTIYKTSESVMNKARCKLSPRIHTQLTQTKHSGSAFPFVSGKHTNQSAAEAGACSQMNSLAGFFDTVSFVDAHLSRQSRRKHGHLGVKVSDGFLDEPRDEDEEEMKMQHVERCYEIQAVVEALGFHSCKIKPGDQDVTGGNTTWKLREQRRRVDVVHRVLHSEAFRYHGAQAAVLTDYLPCLRFICREQQRRPRPTHYLRQIGLRLSKNVLDLLVCPLL